MKHFVLFCAAAAAAISSPAMAAKTFKLDGVTLQGDSVNGAPVLGTLTGTFTTDDALSTLLAVDITASAGTWAGRNFPAFTFNNIAWKDGLALPTQGLQLTAPGFTQQLRLNFTAPLTSTGTGIIINNSYESQHAYGNRWILSGKIVAAPVAPSGVPEPTTWAMMIGGLAIVGAAMRRRTTAVRLA